MTSAKDIFIRQNPADVGHLSPHNIKQKYIVPSQYTIILQAGGKKRERKGTKFDPVPTVEFILKLHPEEKNKNKTMSCHVCIIGSTIELTAIIPVQAKSMKKCRQALHYQENGHSENSKQAKHWHQE